MLKKRLAVLAGGVAVTGGMFAGPLAGSAAACTNTINAITGLEMSCTPTCPPPTYPRAAVYVDGTWVVVCA